jgi:hypothetical protein
MTKIELDVRNWECPVCGVRHDRDLNAAINIHVWGLMLIDPKYTSGTGDNACGDMTDIQSSDWYQEVSLKQEAATSLESQ